MAQLWLANTNRQGDLCSTRSTATDLGVALGAWHLGRCNQGKTKWMEEVDLLFGNFIWEQIQCILQLLQFMDD
jgi:hypothetical protein